MNKNLLITFGCSWTYGVGVGYQTDQIHTEYNTIAWDPTICGEKSFRGILSKNFAMDNKNFAHGQSSNQAQFSYAKKYFSGIDFKHDQETYDKIIVLHAITSTARNIFFDLEKMSVVHCKYDSLDKFGKFMIKHSYDHNHEVEQLEVEMNFWNVFYKTLGVKNIWVDTFNHHHYDQPIDNMIDINNRDLMSHLCLKNNIENFDSNYHYSSWKIDSNKVAFLVDIGLLNPISYHPTADAHVQIADFIAPMIQSRL